MNLEPINQMIFQTKALRSSDLRWMWLRVALLVAVALGIVALGDPVVEAESDTEPPELVGLSFSPTMVDVTNGPATTTVTLHVTDALSGISTVEIGFQSPVAGQRVAALTENPISGDKNDGTFEVTVTIGQFAESGPWTAFYVILGDSANNRLTLNGSQISALGFPTQLTVVSTTVTVPSLSVLGVVVMFVMLSSAIVLRYKRAVSAER
jgi:hypothetical protein